jgi:hypothetical protein
MPDNNLPIIPHLGSTLVRAGPLGGRIVLDMVNAALSFSRADTALVPQYTIGEHVFCEPDYRQMLLWAKTLGMEPAEVVRRLLFQSNSLASFFSFNLHMVLRKHGSIPGNDPVFKDGRINQLYWDMQLLPLERFEWVDGLVIEAITFKSSGALSRPRELNLSLPLPNLRSLFCTSMGLAKLDLSMVPRLTALACDYNQLTELDLSAIPRLTSLSCDCNQLTELDLSDMSCLTNLSCNDNNLTELDVSLVPQLTSLSCFHNEISKLAVSPVPQLTCLDCSDNEITKLDLSAVPQLTSLYCSGNELTELDLSAVPQLTCLDCSGNDLTELDLANTSPLTELSCNYNQLTKLDLSNVTQLRKLSCGHNQLIKLDLSNVPQLEGLSCGGNHLTNLDITCLENYPFFGLIEVDDKTSPFQSYDEDNRIPFRSTGPNTQINPFELDYDEDKTRLIQRPDQNF